MENNENREHIGDGVYLNFTGYSIEISVNDHRNSPVVHLELGMADKIKAFEERMKAKHKKS